MQFCDTYLKFPANFSLFALVLNVVVKYIFKASQKQFYNNIAKLTSCVCLIWAMYDLIVNQTITIEIAGVAWFVDLVMSVYATMIIKNDYSIGLEMLINPVSNLMDIIYDDDDVFTITRNQRTLLKMSAFFMSLLWLPIVGYWSLDNCFIDNMMDITTPFGLYSTVMIILMYINFVPFVTSFIMDIDLKAIVIFLAFFNVNYAIVVLFAYIV